jgi:hypothetical protein
MGTGAEDVEVMFKQMRFWELRPWLRLTQNQVKVDVEVMFKQMRFWELRPWLRLT